MVQKEQQLRAFAAEFSRMTARRRQNGTEREYFREHCGEG